MNWFMFQGWEEGGEPLLKTWVFAAAMCIISGAPFTASENIQSVCCRYPGPIWFISTYERGLIWIWCRLESHASFLLTPSFCNSRLCHMRGKKNLGHLQHPPLIQLLENNLNNWHSCCLSSRLAGGSCSKPDMKYIHNLWKKQRLISLVDQPEASFPLTNLIGIWCDGNDSQAVLNRLKQHLGWSGSKWALMGSACSGNTKPR